MDDQSRAMAAASTAAAAASWMAARAAATGTVRAEPRPVSRYTIAAVTAIPAHTMTKTGLSTAAELFAAQVCPWSVRLAVRAITRIDSRPPSTASTNRCDSLQMPRVAGAAGADETAATCSLLGLLRARERLRQERNDVAGCLQPWARRSHPPDGE